MASGHIFHILKCKTRFQAEESSSKYFGLFSSPIETVDSAGVAPLPRLKSAHRIECEPPCAATTAASHPSCCRQRNPPRTRREKTEARYIVQRLQLWHCNACAAAHGRRARGRRCSRAVAPCCNAADHAAAAGGPGPGPEQSWSISG